jgi:uncharacterized protein
MEKLDQLGRRLRSLESAVVAFSGGVDSSVLAVACARALGSRMIAVTAVSPSFPESDRQMVEEFCTGQGIAHEFVGTREIDDPDYASNPENRCYFCKKHLMNTLIGFADEKGLEYVVEGTNLSDLDAHRPGHAASREQVRVVTPLIETGFTKEDVRSAAKELGISTAQKPAAACLASRVPTGVAITADLLRRIDRAEDLLRGMGVSQVRVRHHGDTARIEVDGEDMGAVVGNRDEIARALQELGWRYVSLDLRGYRTGSLSG